MENGIIFIFIFLTRLINVCIEFSDRIEPIGHSVIFSYPICIKIFLSALDHCI